ncbi:hypothetical protein NDU88_002394 [Pleurodeles waltl]|uniref:Uncharacterized protein n=1 Tax=Pleurodeles waltl TaxID=8319 RepID=A0AAV7T296_PLEWA|nr:hypothetical protein NDU88_002394 [Pleurodeles waltl]
MRLLRPVARDAAVRRALGRLEELRSPRAARVTGETLQRAHSGTAGRAELSEIWTEGGVRPVLMRDLAAVETDMHKAELAVAEGSSDPDVLREQRAWHNEIDKRLRIYDY